ncbi:hypothetical protein PV328_003297 [Microctonus aethiopoides]|uniref:Uncharacterized protein n=1 Tax=Microctonus aethiopoides TaxID=144406 RepID=A0AA39F854_9HYME|nr:hypothetical protein PV328_003297 [Microctonus aethiopoides]
MRRKYLNMKFNNYIRVDGDPTEEEITVTWLRNITDLHNMELLYIIQTPEGEEVISKSYEPPTLCSGSYQSDDWDFNIIKIYFRSLTNNNNCPIQSGKIDLPYSFDIDISLNHKLPWKSLNFIMDLYPFNEMESVSMLVLEGYVHLL